MKRHLITFLKFAIPLAIILWLVANIDEEQLRQLRERPKHWGMLAAAFSISMAAVCITFVRWHMLVRGLEMPFRLRDAFRLGFLGYLLNFVSVGSVGGDLFKAFFIAREQPGRRAEAVATVVVDRMIGLYALLLVASAAILLSDLGDPSPEVIVICRMTFLATGLGGIAVLMVLVPGFTSGSVSRFLAGLPKVGTTFESLIAAVRMYRTKPVLLAVISAMSLSVHALFALSIYLAAGALFERVPTLAEHFIIVPLSFVVGALPFTPAGLGTLEFALDQLYARVPADVGVTASGVTIALAFRVITVAIAAIGVVYYWTSRREVRQILAEAQQEELRGGEGPDVGRDYAGNSP